MPKMRVTLVTLVLFCCIYFSKNAAVSVEDLEKHLKLVEGRGLYTEKDNILILTGKNFTEEVYGQSYSLLVEFYNTWCGDCQRFAPTWKALAAQMQGLKEVLVIAAIDCYEAENIPVCRDMEIAGTPTIRYFHEYYEKGPENIGRNVVEKDTDLIALKEEIFKTIVDEQREFRALQFPGVLPYFAPILDDLYLDMTPPLKYIFVILEQKYPLLGPETAIRLREIPEVSVKYSPNNNTELIENTRITKSASVVVLDKNNQSNVLAQGLKTIESVFELIGNFLEPKGIKIPELSKPQNVSYDDFANETVASDILKKLKEERNLRRIVQSSGDVVFQEDLETALRQSFSHEVASVKTISGEQLESLAKYVRVLEKYFPLSDAGKQVLADLGRKIAAAGEALEGSEIGQWIEDAAEKNTFNFPLKFVACKGSLSKYRGYTCSLWKMFHYLTVNAAIENEDNAEAYPREVLDAMLGYIKHFFKCRDCSNNFQKMVAVHKMADVNSIDSAALWLWKAHNHANKRLSGDTTEDPAFPKMQFPLAENCPRCKNSNHEWNIPEVFKYLKKVYAKEHIVYFHNEKVLPWKNAK